MIEAFLPFIVSESVAALHIIAERTDDSVDALVSVQHTKQINEWLSAPDPSINYAIALQQRHKDTGLWFIHSETFEVWKKDRGSFLWLYGIPGCGKTILSSAVVHDLKKTSHVPRVLLYFFFDFSDTNKQSFEKMLRTLLIQLYRQRENTRQQVDQLYTTCRKGSEQPTLEALVSTLRDTLSLVDEVTIVLDALDESKSREELLTWLKALMHDRSTILHVLVTARKEEDIASSIESWAQGQDMIAIQRDDVNEDIRAYVHDRIQHDDNLKRWHGRPEVQQNIEEMLMKKSDGM